MIDIEDVYHCLSCITGILSHQRNLDDGSPETEYLLDSMKGNEDVGSYPTLIEISMYYKTT